MDPWYPHHTYDLKDSVGSLSQWPPEHTQTLGPFHLDYTRYTHLTKHALVMGNTWGLLIPLTILMATLRHKKQGWWFQLHRASAVLSLILVVTGVILGRRLRITHPPVTTAGKMHKFMGYTALSFICLQALSTLLWRPLGSHSFRPTWNVLHQTWGKATMAVGIVTVFLGIRVAGVGWVYYILFALQAGSILAIAQLQKPSKASSKSEPTFTESVQVAGTHVEQAVSTKGSLTESAGGIIPWLLRQQSSVKQA